ncbi:F subunit of K+-transporting ATPase, Potass_KdpF [Variibacter gotjawalensis]|uniref:F subunit of K+-transporting ATPase, Potass_KdpF n=1 Tax=Variibacter gotjawalensis TaxID=1333996 RepID=A0A0S3PR95_9BRAD|nr:K(+)-transporting ATPase subunit F [Variibacter gotjawalensis]NIK48764.1 K+-transporting ATPase KdpF subunit [Variibacter gotjawalensis]RZS50625.1 K+-transporting ATPase KdpF subunit [Variibacter gotjawalensis]BAT58458.1 F subunit of K+-transporting ATPase, Potass_KdpF [Variibacter gotjawalensis]
MMFDLALALAFSLGALVYLFVALLRPERF